MSKLIFIVLVLILLVSACKESSTPTSPSLPDSGSPSNQWPRITSLTGPTSCKVSQTYTYEAKGYDPDGNRVAFHFNIYRKESDAPITLGWGPYVDNNKEYEKDIAWNYGPGEFYICAHCKDEAGLETLGAYHYTLDVTVTE